MADTNSPVQLNQDGEPAANQKSTTPGSVKQQDMEKEKRAQKSRKISIDISSVNVYS